MSRKPKWRVPSCRSLRRKMLSCRFLALFERLKIQKGTSHVGFKEGYGDLMGFKGLNGIEWLPPSCKHTKRNQKMFPWEKHLHMVLFSMKNTAKRTRICLMFFRGKYGKTQILMVYHHFLKQKDSFRHTHVGCFTKQ